MNYQEEIAGHVYRVQGIECGHLLPNQIPTLILDTILKYYLFYKQVINPSILAMFPFYKPVTLTGFSAPVQLMSESQCLPSSVVADGVDPIPCVWSRPLKLVVMC